MDLDKLFKFRIGDHVKYLQPQADSIAAPLLIVSRGVEEFSSGKLITYAVRSTARINSAPFVLRESELLHWTQADSEKLQSTTREEK